MDGRPVPWFSTVGRGRTWPCKPERGADSSNNPTHSTHLALIGSFASCADSSEPFITHTNSGDWCINNGDRAQRYLPITTQYISGSRLVIALVGKSQLRHVQKFMPLRHGGERTLYWRFQILSLDTHLAPRDPQPPTQRTVASLQLKIA